MKSNIQDYINYFYPAATSGILCLDMIPQCIKSNWSCEYLLLEWFTSTNNTYNEPFLDSGKIFYFYLYVFLYLTEKKQS